MLINFYEEVRKASAERKKCPHTMKVMEAEKFVESFSKEQQAKLAYHFNQWEWDTDVLGEFKGYELAWEYANIFMMFVSQYEQFKFECLKAKGKTEEEFKEEVIAAIYNAIMRR